MAMSVTYTNFSGGLVYENRAGTESYYASDTLGSTTALVSSAGTVTDTWTYWPFGEVQSRTGSTTTPFTFVGTLGYFQDLLNNFVYVRARFLRVALGRWQTVDPIWPKQQPYSYVVNDPLDVVDPNGMNVAVAVCAVACGGCLICLAGFVSACNSCKTAQCWIECVFSVWAELPWWAKLLCGAACGGCLVCMFKALQKLCAPTAAGVFAPTATSDLCKIEKCIAACVLIDCHGKTGEDLDKCQIDCSDDCIRRYKS